MEKKKRLIPVLLLKNGMLVQSRGFNRHQILGNPITAVKRLSEWASDELIYLDISRDDSYDLKRDDQGYENIRSFLGIIEYISKDDISNCNLLKYFPNSIPIISSNWLLDSIAEFEIQNIKKYLQ